MVKIVEAWGTGRFDNTTDVSLQVVPLARRLQQRLAFTTAYIHPGGADLGFYLPTEFAYGPEIYYEVRIISSRNNLMQILLGKMDGETLEYLGDVAEWAGYGGAVFKFPAGLFLNNDPLELLFFEIIDYSGEDCIITVSGTGVKATYKVPYQTLEKYGLGE